MTVTESEPVVPPALVARVKAILLKPAAEWVVIDAEPATIQGIYKSYLIYLAAIGPICSFIGLVVFAHISVLSALISSVVLYLVWLAVPYAMSLAISEIAPRFGGEKNQVQAFKVAAYAPTASMLSGVFAIFPPISALAVVGFYSIYLLWLGLPKLMKIPEEKALGFFAVILGVGLLIGIILFSAVGRFGI